MNRRTFLLGGVAAAAAACAGAAHHRSSSAQAPATGGATAAPTTAPASTFAPTGPATFVSRGPSTATGVALTFHTAGPVAYTESLLTQAAQNGAKLTFFIVGTWLAQHPGMAARIQAAGHDLGNHTYSHGNIAAMGPTQMYEEIARCGALLRAETGSIGRWFRPSQTDVPSAAILQQAGRAGYATSVGYDVDPLDYTDPGAAAVLSRTKARLHGGAIVSLHTLYQGTATAFGDIVGAIHAAGLQPVTLSTLLG